MDKKMYTVKDIKEYFNCGINQAYSIVSKRDFPKIKIGRKYYVPKEQFEKWISRNAYN